MCSNSSAEEAPEELAEGETQVNNVVYSFRLVATQFDKKSFMTYLKVRSIILLDRIDTLY